MLQSVARYTNDAVGIEKALKFVQSFSQVAEVMFASTPEELARWAMAKEQANIGRRYFRIVKWIDCWTTAYNLLTTYNSPSASTGDEKPQKNNNNSNQDAIRVTLMIAKFSLLGIFLFMEMFCIADAMHITHNSWAPGLQFESLKFWFYSLAVSIVLGLYDLFMLDSSAAHAEPPAVSEKTKAKVTVRTGGKEASTVIEHTPAPQNQNAHKRQAILKNIVADSCDLLIPGSIVGWIPIDPVPVGIAGTLSAILGGSDAWARVNP
ncbi:hypothetical protein PV08_08285 [Exophiala spinifera]|uniref:Peroxisomal biogenesis factor 11 n=1 Tax=Exophiala spinifera TaxID=91928 RepID=A0A0D2B2G9_9EURO|nr:uncharacterized protein PV08_08285 [Exophiala spinifera]KIW13098.1 hypothetical protein PV08_08285 [Exophiala spinifera]